MYSLTPVRQSVNPRLQDPAYQVSHISLRELFVSIQNILVGNSSSLYRWDVLSETFLLPPTADGKRSFIVVDGKDDKLMQRYILTDYCFGFFFSPRVQLHKTLPGNWQSTAPTRHICE